jgi:hypothetical protein
MSESPLKITSAIIDLSTGIVTWEGEGKVTADNGDYYLINSITYRNPDGSFTGEVWMKDGIGKFEGATGSVTTTGKDNCWTAQGTIEYN